jgi:hypothetical protein
MTINNAVNSPYGFATTTLGSTIGSVQVVTGSTTSGYANIPGKNRLVNGNLQIWQRGAGGSASFAVNAATAYTADRWQVQSGASTNVTVSQVAGTTSGQYRMRVQRNAANTGTGAITIAQSLPRSVCSNFGGSYATFSFQALVGANFSPTSNNVTVKIISGQGTSDVSVLSGFTTQVTEVSATKSMTTALVTYTATTGQMNAAVSQMAVEITFTPVGTAGVNDYIDIGQLQLEHGPNATFYEHKTYDEYLRESQYYFCKSFAYGTAPAQNIGNSISEMVYAAARAATGTQVAPTVPWPVNMRATPTLTTYSTNAATNQVYDVGSSNPCTAITTFVLSDRAHSLYCSGAATTGIGNILVYNWSADAELV